MVATATATRPIATAAPVVTSTPTATPELVTIYIVEDGDTAWAIAGEHGITLADLAGANGMTEAELDHLQIGQELRIPR